MPTIGLDPNCARVETREAIELPMVTVAAAALVDPDGRVLVSTRPAGRHLAGLWEFPGGKVRSRESPEAAVIRELYEELSVDITASCLAPLAFSTYSYDEFRLVLLLFVCRVWRGVPVPREGQELKWVRPNDLRMLSMPPADAPLVAMLRDTI